MERPRTFKKARMKKTEIKTGGQGQCNVSADEDEILIIKFRPQNINQAFLPFDTIYYACYSCTSVIVNNL